VCFRSSASARASDRKAGLCLGLTKLQSSVTDNMDALHDDSRPYMLHYSSTEDLEIGLAKDREQQESVLAWEENGNDAWAIDSLDDDTAELTGPLVLGSPAAPTNFLDSHDERGGVPGSARWLKERNEALEHERLTLVHQTLEIQVTPSDVEFAYHGIIAVAVHLGGVKVWALFYARELRT